jgi:DNA repair exonuclease SbcCD ATPase subunit
VLAESAPALAEESAASAEPPVEAMPMADSPIEEARHEAAEEFVREQYEEKEHAADRPEPLYPERIERRDFKPAPPAAIVDAIAEVNQIIASLKQVLDQMEEVLETLELAEVQKNVDEREIQSLRNALRQMDRRGSEPRHESHGHHAPPSQRHEPRRGRR